MTITEKYIQLLVPLLATAEGAKVSTKQINGATAYLFPCPYCSHLTTKSGKKKPKKQTAIISPHPKSKWIYYFRCLRGGTSDCDCGMIPFRKFLKTYSSSLCNRYDEEMDFYRKRKS